MRVVFDTNIYVSAFAIPGGRAEEAYLKAGSQVWGQILSCVFKSFLFCPNETPPPFSPARCRISLPHLFDLAILKPKNGS